MIGVLLHLAALAPAAVATHVASAALSLLGRGTPDPSEVDQLGAECDALRAERDEARARVAELRGILRESRALTHEAEGERDDARTLAHEAKLEFSAAREACEQLRGELATARASVQDLLAVADRSAIRCSSCSNAAAAVDKTYAYCDEHMPPNQGQLRELSYAAAMRRGRALLPEVKP